MSFYGSLSDRSRLDLKIDKIYPNRSYMDASCENDSIFLGRYVLVSYENSESNDTAQFINSLKEKKENVIIADNVEDGEVTSEINIYNTCYIEQQDENLIFYLENPYEISDTDIRKNVITISELNESIAENNFFIFREQSFIYDKSTKPFYLDIIEDNGEYYLLNKSSIIPEDYEEYGVLGIEKIINEEVTGATSYHSFKISEENEVEDIVLKAIPENFNTEEKRIIRVMIPVGGSYHLNDKEQIWYYNPGQGARLVSEEELTYESNYQIDLISYPSRKRGYDATVWEKVYIGGQYKYIKIADLNSYVPTLGINIMPPSGFPILPEFSEFNSTNVNYKINWQPTWGFRLGSVRKYSQPKINEENSEEDIFVNDGEKSIYSTDELHSTSINMFKYVAPEYTTYYSDETTYWGAQIFDPKTKYFKNYIFNPHASAEDQNPWVNLTDKDQMTEEEKEGRYGIEAAIYFNKNGFDRETNNYNGHITSNFIKVEPTGVSGRMYYDENGRGYTYPDIQEMSIMLPALGNSVAEMWNIIYGKGDEKTKKRNLDISWSENKDYLQTREGLRMYGDDLGYYPKNLETLAGCINTAHDLIGMVVKTVNVNTEDITNPENAEKYDDLYVYYNEFDKKFYMKKSYCGVQEVTEFDSNPSIYKEVGKYSSFLEEDKITNQGSGSNTVYYYFKDYGTNDDIPNYIKDDIIRTGKEYCLLEVSEITYEEAKNPYEPNKYFYRDNNNYILETAESPQRESNGDDTIPYYKASYYDNKVTSFKFIPENTINYLPYLPGTFYYEVPSKSNKRQFVLGLTNNMPYLTEEDKQKDTSGKNWEDYFKLESDGKWVPKVWYLSKEESGESEYVLKEEYIPIVLDDLEKYGQMGQLYNSNRNLISYDKAKEMLQNREVVYVCQPTLVQSSNIEIDTEYEFYLTDLSSGLGSFSSNEAYSSFYYYSQGQVDNKLVTQFMKYDYEVLKNVILSRDNSKEFYCIKFENIEFDTTQSIDKTKNYYQEINGNYYYIYPHTLVHNKKYLILEETLISLFNPKAEYYYRDENGNYQLFKTELNLSADTILYEKIDYRILEDLRTDSLSPGTKINTLSAFVEDGRPIEGVKIGIASQKYHMIPLEGFERNLNTMIGLIMKMNNLISEDDIYTRDRSTLQGSINAINDIFSKIGDLGSNSFLMTDSNGVIQGYSQSEGYGFHGDDWVRISFEKDGGNRGLNLTHKDVPSYYHRSEEDSEGVEGVYYDDSPVLIDISTLRGEDMEGEGSSDAVLGNHIVVPQIDSETQKVKGYVLRDKVTYTIQPTLNEPNIQKTIFKNHLAGSIISQRTLETGAIIEKDTSNKYLFITVPQLEIDSETGHVITVRNIIYKIDLTGLISKNYEDFENRLHELETTALRYWEIDDNINSKISLSQIRTQSGSNQSNEEETE